MVHDVSLSGSTLATLGKCCGNKICLPGSKIVSFLRLRNISASPALIVGCCLANIAFSAFRTTESLGEANVTSTLNMPMVADSYQEF